MRAVLQHPTYTEKHENVERVVKRASLSPNSESGCERSISKTVRYKNKHSSKMSVPVMNARQRCGENGPPLHLFAEKCTPAIVKYWTKNKHKLAKKVRDFEINQSKVLKKIRKEKEYTSKIFF